MSGFAPIQTFRKQDPAGSPFTAGSAVNGTSIDALGRVVLGNDIGEAGAPGRVLSPREIDLSSGNIFFVQRFPADRFFTEIRTSVIGVFSDSDLTEASLSPGSLALGFPGTSSARIVLGVNQVGECEMRWSGVSQTIRVGDFVSNFLYTLFFATGNFLIGPDTLADNGSKLQIDGNMAMQTVQANLDFPNTNAQESSDLTIGFSGAAVGDMVALGFDPAVASPNTCFTAWVSNVDEITVRFNNYSAVAIDPAAADFNVSIFKPL